MILFQNPSRPRESSGRNTSIIGPHSAPTTARARTTIRVRVRAALGGLLLLAAPLLLAMPASARPHRAPAKQASASDSGYVFALAAANRFLHAWQTGDLANGMVLLSDGLRHSQNADKLEQFFATATERAFEIHAGHGHHERYSFPVVLLAPRGTHVARRSSEIVVLNTGKNDWVVDKLP